MFATNRWSGMFRALLVSAVCVLGVTPATMAAQRFQMAVFVGDTDDPVDDSNYADLGWLKLGEAQPGGSRHSVLFVPHPKILEWLALYNGQPEAQWPSVDAEVRAVIANELDATNPDWSRVDALLIDEPFLTAVDDSDSANPCNNQYGVDGQLTPPFRALLLIQRLLVNAAAVLRDPSRSPSTRFWANFSEVELDWMQDENCPFLLNDWYMDVVSMDKYSVPFSALEFDYDWLFANRPTTYQQLALVPGTFYATGAQPDSASAVKTRLQGFFDYANAANQTCYLRIGRTGVTKSADGCPVWLVAAFWNGVSPVPTNNTFSTHWVPMFHGDSGAAGILNDWSAQLQLPRRSNLLGTTETFDIHNGVISGWAVDRSQVDVLPCVDVWMDNTTYFGCALPTTTRADVEAGTGIAMSGFTFNISSQHMLNLHDGNCHTIDVYAVARAPGVGTAKIGSTVHCP